MFSSDEWFLCVCVFFFKNNFSKNIRQSNILDLDLARRFVGSDLDINCLQMSSADDESRCKQNKKGIGASSGRFIYNDILFVTTCFIFFKKSGYIL